MKFKFIQYLLLVVVFLATFAHSVPVNEEESQESERISIFKSLLEMDEEQISENSKNLDKSVEADNNSEDEVESPEPNNKSQEAESNEESLEWHNPINRHTTDLESDSIEEGSGHSDVSESLDNFKNKFALGERGFNTEANEEETVFDHKTDETEPPLETSTSTTEKAKTDQISKVPGFFKKVYVFLFGDNNTDNEAKEDHSEKPNEITTEDIKSSKDDSNFEENKQVGKTALGVTFSDADVPRRNHFDLFTTNDQSQGLSSTNYPASEVDSDEKDSTEAKDASKEDYNFEENKHFIKIGLETAEKPSSDSPALLSRRNRFDLFRTNEQSQSSSTTDYPSSEVDNDEKDSTDVDSIETDRDTTEEDESKFTFDWFWFLFCFECLHCIPAACFQK